MPLTDTEMATALAPAGLRLVERDRARIRIPVEVAHGAPSCGPEDGRIDATADEVAHHDDPDAAPRLNAGWYRLATQYGLITSRREFLLAVDYADANDPDPEPAWVRVRLLDRWDVAGGRVSALGTHGSPEFTALSTDGQVLMRTTMWGDGRVSSLVVPAPATIASLRRYAEQMTRSSYYAPAVQEAARAWLTAGTGPGARPGALNRPPVRPRSRP